MEEYRKHIESDAALERRFQPIVVNEPSVDETIKILYGIRGAYEEHHRLTISNEALEAAARLSARYVNDRFLPDKAIDLIDEGSSRVRMCKSSAQNQQGIVIKLREVREKRALAIEEHREEDASSLADQEATLEKKFSKLQSSWDRETSPVVSAEDIARARWQCGRVFRLCRLPVKNPNDFFRWNPNLKKPS